MSAKWLQIRELFESACDLGPVDRETFLTDACGRDAALQAEVESLLAYSEQSPPLMEAPAAEAFPERWA